MSNQKKAAQGNAAAEATVKFSNMNGAQKVGHVLKACVFFLTMGFAYPNIFSD